MKNKLLLPVALLFCVFSVQVADAVIPLPSESSSIWAGFDINTDQGHAGTMSPTYSWFTGIDFILNSTTSNSGVSDGIKLTVTLPNTGDIRDRGTVAGQPFAPLLQDFVFSSAPAGQDKSKYVNLALSDLTPNQEYIVRIYSCDRNSSTHRITGIFDGSGTGNFGYASSTLLATHANVASANLSAAYYTDITRTADANGNIDLVIGALGGGGNAGLFNGLEIVEKPHYDLASVFKVDIKNDSGANGGYGTVQPTFLDWGINNTTKTGSDFADGNKQYFYTDSGIKITIDPQNGDLVLRNRTSSRPFSLEKMDLFRSFIAPAKMEMTLDGLTVGQLYELTLYSAELEGNDNHYNTWSVFKDDAWHAFRAQATHPSMVSEDAREFSYTFEADSEQLKLSAVGANFVFLNGFELKELADPSIAARVDVNTTRDTNNRPIAAWADELLFAKTDASKSMTTAGGIDVTLGITNATSGNPVADKSRFRNSSRLGHSLSQKDYYDADGNVTASLAMMQDFIFAGEGETLTLTLDGLTVGNDYELTIYSQDLEMNSGTTEWTLEGDAMQMLFSTIYGELATVDDWSHTVGFVADSPILTLFSTPGPGQFAFLNGFELTDNGPATPEPATWIMLLLACAMGGFVVRQQKRQ